MKLRILAAACFTATCVSCIDINNELGRDLIATDQQYDIYTVEIPVEDISVKFTDELSGLSSNWISIGAVRDEEYGLTTRSAAFSLVPVYDTLDFGRDPIYCGFHFAAPLDTVSITDDSQQYILQNVHVYELEEAIDFSKKSGTNTLVKHKGKRITKGIPVFNGTDSLSFDFTEEFGKKYMQILQSDLDTMPHYTAKYPGIFITMDPPVGNGGRINMFDVSCFVVYDNVYTVDRARTAELKFNAIYDGVRKDTSFFFLYGEPEFFDEYEYIENMTRVPQYSYNMTTHETRGSEGPVQGDILIEGGGGLKPVISAADLQRKALAAIKDKGDPSKVIINRATLVLPFTMPDDYRQLEYYPQVLSPTCRIVPEDKDKDISFAGLTDASNSQENQGDLDRSNLQYVPDITHHLQELIRLDDPSKISNYDIWLLIVSNEEIETATSTNEQNEYYQQMMYASYYNNLYNGYGYGYGYSPYGYGYGGYGGYGYGGYGYGGYGYSNYYSYAMMAAMYGSSSSSTTTTPVLDLSRFYKARLTGPGAKCGRVPTLKITYSLPRE